MAIPDRSLKVTLDVEKLTLDELVMLDGHTPREEFSAYVFRQFLVKNTNWTPQEIGGLTVAEMREELGPRIQQAIQEAALPLESGPRSENGRGSEAILSPAGLSSLPTPSSSDSIPNG